MSESIRKLNENPVTALADTDYIVACDSQGNLSPIKKADFTAGIQAGGRNLVKNSNSKGTTNTYHVATFYFGEDKPKQGEVITVTIWGDFSKIEYLSLWNSGGDISIGGALKINDNLLRAHVLWNTFNDSNPQDIINTVSLQIFKYPNNNTNVTIDRIMVERGSVAHDWTPAPEDILDRLTALENRGGVIASHPTTCNQQEKGGRHERSDKGAYRQVSERDYDECDGDKRNVLQSRHMLLSRDLRTCGRFRYHFKSSDWNSGMESRCVGSIGQKRFAHFASYHNTWWNNSFAHLQCRLKNMGWLESDSNYSIVTLRKEAVAA